MAPSAYFWSQRYKAGHTGWDLGEVSPPLKAFAGKLAHKDQRLLIPGAGNSYEAEYLHRQGFTQVHVLDIAAEPLENLSRRVPDFPVAHLHHGDFFSHKGSYDLILEQTFFCALQPEQRPRYAEKMHELLAPAGKLVGLLFDFPLTDQGPPFGGSREEYLRYFEPHFQVRDFEKCYNSAPGREGIELFFRVEK